MSILHATKALTKLHQSKLAHTSNNQLNEAIMDQQASAVNIETVVPFMHYELFAEKVGLSEGVIRGWIDLGYLPTVKVGRYQLINLVLLSQNLKMGKVL